MRKFIIPVLVSVLTVLVLGSIVMGQLPVTRPKLPTVTSTTVPEGVKPATGPALKPSAPSGVAAEKLRDQSAAVIKLTNNSNKKYIVKIFRLPDNTGLYTFYLDKQKTTSRTVFPGNQSLQYKIEIWSTGTDSHKLGEKNTDPLPSGGNYLCRIPEDLVENDIATTLRVRFKYDIGREKRYMEQFEYFTLTGFYVVSIIKEVDDANSVIESTAQYFESVGTINMTGISDVDFDVLTGKKYRIGAWVIGRFFDSSPPQVPGGTVPSAPIIRDYETGIGGGKDILIDKLDKSVEISLSDIRKIEAPSFPSVIKEGVSE